MPRRRKPISADSLRKQTMERLDRIDEHLGVLIPRLEKQKRAAEELMGGSLEGLASGKMPKRRPTGAKTGWTRPYGEEYDRIFGKGKKRNKLESKLYCCVSYYIHSVFACICRSRVIQ